MYAPLNSKLNYKPKEIKSIYLMGVGGVAMAALAGLLVEKGYQVFGSDQNLYPPMSDVLKNLNITLYEGYHPKNLASNPDLVIIGNVVTRKFIEIKELARLKIPYISMPQAINLFFLDDKKSVVISGCHGKTTTTALTAHLFYESNLKPSFLIGGAPSNFKNAFKLDQGKHFIIEGDEYDDVFYSKQAKFIHYKPNLVILTSIEFDHADIYPDLETMLKAYQKMIALIPSDGYLLANGDDPLVRKVSSKAKCKVDFYGENENNTWQIKQIKLSNFNTEFTLIGANNFQANLSLAKPGQYNAFNAAAATILALKAGIDISLITSALKTFQGVKRRQELICEQDNIMLVDDFAHHPTAVKNTLEALKKAFPQKRLLAVFEARSNTSRRAVFQNDYGQSFKKADLIFLSTVPNPEKAPQGDRLDIEILAHNIKTNKNQVEIFTGSVNGLQIIKKYWQSGDLIVVMSNGSFDGLVEKLKNSLMTKGKQNA